MKPKERKKCKHKWSMIFIDDGEMPNYYRPYSKKCIKCGKEQKYDKR